jgi:hypothetical protein
MIIPEEVGKYWGKSGESKPIFTRKCTDLAHLAETKKALNP